MSRIELSHNSGHQHISPFSACPVQCICYSISLGRTLRAQVNVVNGRETGHFDFHLQASFNSTLNCFTHLLYSLNCFIHSTYLLYLLNCPSCFTYCFAVSTASLTVSLHPVSKSYFGSCPLFLLSKRLTRQKIYIMFCNNV